MTAEISSDRMSSASLNARAETVRATSSANMQRVAEVSGKFVVWLLYKQGLCLQWIDVIEQSKVNSVNDSTYALND